MKTRAAGDNMNATGSVERANCLRTERRVKHLAIRCSLFECLRNSFSLFVNLLLHVVTEVTTLGSICRQFTFNDRAVRFVAAFIVNRDRREVDDGDVTLFQDLVVARYRQQRSNIARNEVLALADANDCRTTGPRDDQPIRVGHAHDSKRVRTLEVGNRLTNCQGEITGILQAMMNGMRDDFCVSFGFKGVAEP